MHRDSHIVFLQLLLFLEKRVLDNLAGLCNMYFPIMRGCYPRDMIAGSNDTVTMNHHGIHITIPFKCSAMCPGSEDTPQNVSRTRFFIVRVGETIGVGQTIVSWALFPTCVGVGSLFFFSPGGHCEHVFVPFLCKMLWV